MTTEPPVPLWQGLFEKALEDSEKALGLDGENIRALFRKARALNELGRHKEAYECSSRCSLALPHVSAAVYPLEEPGSQARRQPSARVLSWPRDHHLFLSFSFLLCDVVLRIVILTLNSDCVPGVAKDTLY